MNALTVLAAVAGAALALVLAALILPAWVSLCWQDGQLRVRAGVLGLSVGLWPPRPKTPRQLARQQAKAEARAKKKAAAQARRAKKERQKAEQAKRAAPAKPAAGDKQNTQSGKSGQKAAPAPQKNAPKKARPKRDLAENLRRLSCLVARAGWLAKKVLRAVQVRRIVLVVPVQGETAASTAWEYGGLWAGLSASLGVLQRGLDLRFERLELWPDFAGLGEGREVLSCKIQARLIIMIAAGLYTLYGLYRDRVF